MTEDGSGCGPEAWLILVVLVAGGLFGVLIVLILGGGVVPVASDHAGGGVAPPVEPARVSVGLAGAAGLAAMARWLNMRDD